MEQAAQEPTIPESFLEYRQLFAEPWVDRWLIPNPFVRELLTVLRPVDVELTDFSFNKDAVNIGEAYLNVSIRKLGAAVRIGLDTVTFVVSNPDWSMAPQLASLVEAVSDRVRELIKLRPKSQETILAFHVTQGASDFRSRTALLVNQKLTLDCLFCGISLHRSDGALIIDKSLKYEGGAFIRLQRRFAGDATFSEVSARLYEDELSALRLLGIAGVV